MVIQSFSVAYVPIEDRLLLQVRGATENYNFWLTRRAAGMFNMAVQSLLMRIYKTAGVRDEHVPIAQSFGQQHAEAFNLPYDDQLTEPQSQPLLLFRIDYGNVNQGHGQLVLLDEQGNGQALQLNEQMLHSINGLLSLKINEAGWNDPLVQPQPEASLLMGTNQIH